METSRRQGNYPPLTPFMVHTWRARLGSDFLNNSAEDAEQFIFWFFDTFHRSRAPYHWPVPKEVLAWINHPVEEISVKLQSEGGSDQRHYLTRFMRHAKKHFGNDSNVSDPDAYLKFLTWFAVECVPAWNLPRTFVPPDLLSILNQPIRLGLPVTMAMLVTAVADTGSLQDVNSLSDAELLAVGFEQMPKLMRAGDPRLIPGCIDEFWNRRLFAIPDSINAYEYFASRVCRPADDGSNVVALREWFTREYLSVVPEAAIFASCPQTGSFGDPEVMDMRPSELTVNLYRDHLTVAGLSRAGLEMKEALIRAGVPVVDLDFSFGRERMRQEYTHNVRESRYGRRVLHILALNPEYVPECVFCHLPNVDDDAHVIGHFYWELSDISTVHECGLSLVDEVWVASNFLKTVYEKRVRVPIFVIGQSIKVDTLGCGFNRSSYGLPDQTYVFLSSFDATSVLERKNPLAAVQAFVKAFPAEITDVVIMLKTRNLENLQTEVDRHHWRRVEEIAARDPRIMIVKRTFTESELNGLYAVCDCYVSLHRSEGFGFGPAEAMAHGKPVITTAYSGVVDFCTPDTAMLVNYALETVPIGAYPFMDAGREYHWASPDIDEAALYMRTLYDDPARGRRLGEAGLHLIRQDFSLEALQRRCLSRLRQLGAT